MSGKKDYLGMFNVLKGILILLIVWIHHESFVRGTLLPKGATFPEVFRWSAGVMALFFVIAGYQYRPDNNLRAFIKRQIVSLIVPYGIAIITASVFLFIWHMANPNIIHLWDIRMFLLGGIYGTERNIEIMGIWLGGVGALWFLPTFCFSQILFQCMQCIKKRNCRKIVIWGMTIFGVSFPEALKVILPFFCIQTCTVMGFMEIGRILRDKKILYHKFSPLFVAITIVAAAWCHLFSASNIAANVWKYWMVDYLIAAALCCVVLRVYIKSGIGIAKGSEIFEYIGMYSIIFYCVHSIELFALLWDRRMLDLVHIAVNDREIMFWILIILIYILRVAVLVALTVFISVLMKQIFRMKIKKINGGIN